MFYINNEINTNTVHVYQFLFTDKYEIPLLVHCNKVTINLFCLLEVVMSFV